MTFTAAAGECASTCKGWCLKKTGNVRNGSLDVCRSDLLFKMLKAFIGCSSSITAVLVLTVRGVHESVQASARQRNRAPGRMTHGQSKIDGPKTTLDTDCCSAHPHLAAWHWFSAAGVLAHERDMALFRDSSTHPGKLLTMQAGKSTSRMWRVTICHFYLLDTNHTTIGTSGCRLQLICASWQALQPLLAGPATVMPRCKSPNSSTMLRQCETLESIAVTHQTCIIH
jgi:hypothetical protein